MAQAEVSVRVSPAEQILEGGGLTIRFLLTGDDSRGTLSAFEVTMPGGQRLPAPPHSHDGFEETVYGVTGVVTWTVDGQPFDVGPGEALCIPRGAVHSFHNRRDGAAKCLCVITPGVLGPQYFREMFAVFAAAAGGPPDRGKLAEIMRRHGLTPAASAPAA